MVSRELHQHNCATDQRLLQVSNTNSFRTNTWLFFLPLQTGRTGKTLPWWQQKGSAHHLLQPTALIQHRTIELHSCSQAVRSYTRRTKLILQTPNTPYYFLDLLQKAMMFRLVESRFAAASRTLDPEDCRSLTAASARGVRLMQGPQPAPGLCHPNSKMTLGKQRSFSSTRWRRTPAAASM